MQLLKSFFRELREVIYLSRWGNALFIAVLHLSSYYFIGYYDPTEADFIQPFLLPLIIATLCIASAGYLINDYFDFNIDKINKPSRVEHVQALGKRNLIKWHILLTIVGVLLSLYTALAVGKLRLSLLQLLCIIALFLYSFFLKKHFLVGNIVIGLLSIINLVLVPAYAYTTMIFPLLYAVMPLSLSELLIILSTFAFLLTIIREIIKDSEDIKGDILNGCRTLPIVLGLSKTKIFTQILVLTAALMYGFSFGDIFLSGPLQAKILFIAFEASMLYSMYALQTSYTPLDFGRLSNVIKLAMLLGLISSFYLLPYA